MLRVSKETDYGLVLLCQFATEEGEPAVHSARDLSARTGLPRPIVGKVLKGLSRAGLLDSRRGVNGGYVLSRAPELITVAEVIEALEGPLAVTQCGLEDVSQRCEHEPRCPARGPLARLTDVVRGTLTNLTLSDLTSRDARGGPPETAATAARS